MSWNLFLVLQDVVLCSFRFEQLMIVCPLANIGIYDLVLVENIRLFIEARVKFLHLDHLIGKSRDDEGFSGLILWNLSSNVDDITFVVYGSRCLIL